MKSLSFVKRAFSLVEILVVLAIISVLMGIGMKAFSGQSSQEFSKGLTQISGTLELAQTQALSTRSTVRILMAVDDQDMIFLTLASSDQSPSTESIESASDDRSWAPLAKPLFVKNIKFNDEFVPEAAGMSLLSEGTPVSITRLVSGKEINFENLIQFSPQGEVTLHGSEKIGRGIQWGLESLGKKPQKAVVRISCLTGRVEILREEDLVKLVSPSLTP